MAEWILTGGDLLARKRREDVKLLPITGLHKFAIDEKTSLDILGNSFGHCVLIFVL
jgi:hypothetical protein